MTLFLEYAQYCTHERGGLLASLSTAFGGIVVDILKRQLTTEFTT